MKLPLAWLPIALTTARLALTYLAIIMTLTITFSVILYKSSDSQFQIQIQTRGKGQTGTRSYAVPATGLEGGRFTSRDVADVNSQLQAYTSKARTNLLRRLVMLNLIVLVLGMGFSFYLARRTLRPIESVLEAQSRFASDASHELRTPLAALQAENEAALRRPHLPKATRALIMSNLEEIRRLQELSSGLLSLSHDETVATAPVWIDEIATEAINKVLASAQAKRIIITDGWPHRQILANAPTLLQAVVILLDNAIKYSGQGTTIYLEYSQSDGKVDLQVRDEGIGISNEALPHIFERFYRADVSRSRHQAQGHGLGLSIAQTLMRQQCGTITVTSTVGRGSTFTLRLPHPR